MAAFVVNLARRLARLELYIQSGVYGTRVSPEPQRRNANLMTLADYVTMKPGDLIFFFQARTIYGIGRIVSILPWPESPAPLCNFSGAYKLSTRSSSPYLWMGDDDTEIRWRVFFEPHPYFFRLGVDMDEVLQADTASICRGLPLFWNRSFIKVEDDEANLIAHTILRRNFAPNPAVFANGASSVHKETSALSAAHDFSMDIDDLVNDYVQGDLVSPEGIVQVWLADRLTRKDPGVTPYLGEWDFVCNLYPASPLKPRDYMDEIDLFGYSLSRPPELEPYVSAFKVVEVKYDRQSRSQGNVVDQVMKYVDWIAATRAGGDYGLVQAYVVARGFTPELIEYAEQQSIRHYVIPRRPYETNEWQGLRLIAYEPTTSKPSLRLNIVL